ncbi:hypothetical protein AJ80_08990 [Polytolypa hystricis UAMH7299]|uniref:Glutamyl-tRNA synthetase n=1 Tax=Polytolypa hystricis (strain UAMH7299) TaxID=1447883 RepID=A0A2B7WXZ8_POLH7|nr:hypothetical protein AJ80_08990 [Polytolypa hystricis UAMH7299]
MATKFEKATTLIDAAHADDPTRTTLADGTSIAYELHYANKMTKYLSQHCPTASEALKLAVRAQHLRRWEIPRASYPMNRVGYFAWRTALKHRQADLAQEMCLAAGYEVDEAARVAALVRKEDMKKDEECQVLEDVACLVFLDDQFEGFEKGLDDEVKMVGILRKTWAKMSERGHELALKIDMSERAKELIGKALAA